jgi:flagellar hook-associated protein 3 FlgL
MAVVNRLGSLSLMNNTLGDVTSVQKQIAKLQEQISSGVKAQNFQELNGQVERFTLLESKIRRTEQFMDNNEIALARMQTADGALSTAVDIADQMEDLIVSARNSAINGSIPFVQQMKNMMQSMANVMNTNFDGRYIFGGTNTAVPPVPDFTVAPVNPGFPDASYYAGSGDNLIMRADDNVQYEFPVRADDPAFQKMYAAAHLAIQAYESKSDTLMAKAVDLMQSGQTDLNGAQARTNTAIINVKDTNERLESLTLYWKGVTEKVGKTDIVAATTEMSSYEAMLQATFQVYARLSQLRLSDFL